MTSELSSDVDALRHPPDDVDVKKAVVDELQLFNRLVAYASQSRCPVSMHITPMFSINLTTDETSSMKERPRGLMLYPSTTDHDNM
jgi:hypothetical protein